MRLVDADKLMKLFDGDIKITQMYVDKSVKDNNEHNYLQYIGQLNTLKSYRAIVEDMKTAYDVNKVLKQLQSYKDDIRQWNDTYTSGQISAYEKAIDIVKAGGIDD